jgi:hypothetical protein
MNGGPASLQHVSTSRASPIGATGGIFFKSAPTFFFLSLSLLSFSLTRAAAAVACIIVAAARPPLIAEADPHRPRRLLLTLNRVDFILTSFID